MWKILLLILPIIIISCKETTIDPPDDSNQQHVGITPGCVPAFANTMDHKTILTIAGSSKNGRFVYFQNDAFVPIRYLFDMNEKKLIDLYKRTSEFAGFTLSTHYNVYNCPYNQALFAVEVLVSKDSINGNGDTNKISETRTAFYNAEEGKFVFLNNNTIYYTDDPYFNMNFKSHKKWLSNSQPNNDYFFIGDNKILHLQSNTVSTISNVVGNIISISDDGDFKLSVEIIGENSKFYLNNILINEVNGKDPYLIQRYFSAAFSPDNRFLVVQDEGIIQITQPEFLQFQNKVNTIVIDVQKSMNEKRVMIHRILDNRINFCSAYQSFNSTFSSNFNFLVVHSQKWKGQGLLHGNLYEVSTDGKIVRSFDLENTEVE